MSSQSGTAGCARDVLGACGGSAAVDHEQRALTAVAACGQGPALLSDDVPALWAGTGDRSAGVAVARQGHRHLIRGRGGV